MVPSCAEGGVLGVLCATIGSIMGTEAVKLICGIGDPLLGRLLVYNALDMTFRTVVVRADPVGEAVTELIDYDEFCGVLTDEAAAAAVGSTRTPREVDAALRSPTPPVLIDVREAVEFEINRIDGARLVPKGEILSGRALGDLPHDRPIVLYCKTGIRSAEALAALKKAGFEDATHLQGGIVAWAAQLAPEMPVY